ncbi:RNA polymerase sporulation sigma factor SigH [Veillonella magna]|jgi:RNA polymerase sporulation-specific sigma factor|uniref:RNA polymerase sporulation sigma factor SigH n=1 Tax=Veillonella magna TaxID=464322 RepID=A0ABS2GD58_9FIRM|nr:RNA polymerase sporulation sigma factor SigH [Veillonella magna]MBD8976857.1 RNA polymerase sporulation sigma factor SigH [Veillonella magna]MBM6823934.1 RNA polymerase sporulation sigma factor SigH [Veillonella magna]MBM6912074.1 RNA polymerase sporulation sigma factor SigH [Veillonella magna]
MSVIRQHYEGYDRFEGLKDEDIVRYIQATKDEIAIDFLVEKYKNFVRARARTYFIVGADREDLIQEGMIGLYKAMRDFKADRTASFRAFAELCIVRQIITAIKTATRQKHIPLNSYVSLNTPIYTDESERKLEDVISEGQVASPEEEMINHEDLVAMENSIGIILSKFEARVMTAYLDGKSYQEIGEEVGRSVKSIDNALQRAKRKLEQHWGIHHKNKGAAAGKEG